MGVVAARPTLVTIADLERDGGPDGRWELINGALAEMNASSPKSSRIGARFVTELSIHTRPGRLGDVFGADAGFVPFPGHETVRVPAAAFVRAERLPSPDELGFYRLTPDIVVEVISPTDRASEVLAKAMMWLDAGARLVWVADPETRTVTVYHPDRSSRLLTGADELSGGEVLPDFRVPVASLLA